MACGDASGLATAMTAAVPGDTITLVANSGSQCSTTLSTLNLTVKTPAAPTAEAVLTATISGGAVTGCTITSGGTGYTIAPSVRIVGGGGSGATAHATISAGAVDTCVVDAGGSEYWGAPSMIPVSTENYITIRTSQYASLPPEGRRYQIANHATLSPKLIFTSTSPITITAGSGLYDGAKYWKFQGLEMTFSNAGQVSIFAALAGGSHLWFDRNYIYAQPCPNTTAPYNTNGRIAFSVSSYDVQMTGNYLDCFWGTPPGSSAGSTGSDSMCYLSDTYAEGVTFDNNYCTGWFNGVFLGGSDPPPSATGHAAISSRAAGSATLASPPAAVDLIALELPFEGNTVPITSIVRASSVVTVVTSSPHGFLNGAYVYPKGVTDTSFNVVYDGTGAASCTAPNDSGCRLITVDNSTTFHYTQAGANASSSGGDIVPTTCQRGPAYGCFTVANVSSIVSNTVNFAHCWVGPFAWNTIDVCATIPGLLVEAGGDARWDGPQATNVDITRNQFQRNTTFDQWVVANNGNVGKGCPGEMKFWNGGRLEGNYCGGFPLNTPGFNGNTQYGMAPWVKISNVVIRNNFFQRFIGNNFAGFEYEPMGPGNRVDVINNLWMIPDNDNQSLAGSNVKTLSGPTEYATFNFKHNTVLVGFPFTGFPCTTTGPGGDCYSTFFGQVQSPGDMPYQLLVTPSSTIQDNLLGLGNYGYQCGTSANRPQSDCTSLIEDHNLFVSNSSGACTLGSTCGWTANQFPWTNSTGATTPGQPKWCGSSQAYPCAAASWSIVQMRNPQAYDFTLLGTSPGYRAASDGTDIGANYALINAALGPDNPLIPTGTTAITVSPSNAVIPVSGTQQFSSSVSGSTWSLNPGCIATIAANGVVTASSSPEVCTVTSTLGASSGTATITISAVTVSPSTASITVGGTQQFTANFPSSWSADSGTVSGSGFYTAPSTNGTYTVTATATNGGATGTATVTVTGEPTLIPLSITPPQWTAQTTISTPITQIFTATNLGTGAVTPTVTLSGSATFSITSDTCNATPVAGSAACTVTIQFTSPTVGTFSGNLHITDTAGGDQNRALNVSIPTGTLVNISPLDVTIPVSGFQQFTATTSNGSGVTYSRICPTTGAGGITSTGFFTAPSAADLCTATATAADGSGSSATASITVLAMSVTPSSVTMQILSQQQFTANFQATWAVSGCTGASITTSGRFTAPGAPASCTVTATATNGTASANATVTVVNPPPGTTGGKQKGGKGRWKKFN